MPRPHSADLRKRVVQAREDSRLSRDSIATLFGVGTTPLFRWQQQARQERTPRAEAGPWRATAHAGPASCRGPAPTCSKLLAATGQHARCPEARLDLQQVQNPRERARQHEIVEHGDPAVGTAKEIQLDMRCKITASLRASAALPSPASHAAPSPWMLR